MNSIEQTRRIDALDYLRGFALIGIILVNILALLSVQMPEPHTANAAYQKWLYVFVETRFFSIFSFYLGLAFIFFYQERSPKGKMAMCYLYEESSHYSFLDAFIIYFSREKR